LVQPTATPTSPAVGAGNWQSYRNDQAGYHIAHPPGWTASEQPGDAGMFLTLFTPAGGGPGVSVTSQPGDPPIVAPSETSDRRCERVVAGGLSGVRCVDSNSSILSTTLAGKGRTYVIATTGGGVAEALYQRFLDSFAPSGAQPPQVGPNARRTPTHRLLATPGAIVTP
jgi:hypothetical protein